MKIIYLFSLLTVFALFSCNDDNDNLITVQSTTIKNLAADPTTGFDPTTGAPVGDKKIFTFFRLSDSAIVDHADSATSKWDIGFRANKIIINSGISGPGQAGAFIYNGLFSDLKSVPADSVFKTDTNTALAIGSSWSTYNPATMIVSPTPGKVLVLRTADGKYAKMEILSYYKNAPVSPNAFQDEARYYTYRYSYQADGSKKFE
ncbi:MAG: HmuY family protein [Saprospiraceae bacterium]